MADFAVIWRDKYEFSRRLSAPDRAAFLSWLIEYQLDEKMPEDDGSQLWGSFKMILSQVDKSKGVSEVRREAGMRGHAKRYGKELANDWQNSGKELANAGEQTDRHIEQTNKKKTDDRQEEHPTDVSRLSFSSLSDSGSSSVSRRLSFSDLEKLIEQLGLQLDAKEIFGQLENYNWKASDGGEIKSLRAYLRTAARVQGEEKEARKAAKRRRSELLTQWAEDYNRSQWNSDQNAETALQQKARAEGIEWSEILSKARDVWPGQSEREGLKN